jgi:transposase
MKYMLYMLYSYDIIFSMKLSYNKKSKDPIYYVQRGYRNGKKTTTSNVARIGKHSELLKITDDPLAYAKEEVARRNREAGGNKLSFDMKIDFDEKLRPGGDVASRGNVLNVGYFVLQSIYRDLRLDRFFRDVTKGMKITFDPNLIGRFMTYARILDPDSKQGTYDDLGSYYEKPDFEYVHILRTMDILENNYDEYLNHLFRHSNDIVTRNTSVCYFDCTNYYFEIETEDDDYVDEVTGEIIKGFRKYGYSKQHQPSPLVQMGLFMDSRGIPLSMCIDSGSDNEQICAVPAEKQLSKMLDGRKFVYCADAGLGSYGIRKFNSMGGRAFIVTQSIKKLSGALQAAVFNDCDYRLLEDDTKVSIEMMKTFDKADESNLRLYNGGAYKIICADRAVDVGLYDEVVLKNGKVRKVKSKAMLKQRLIITFSRKTMEYQRYVRNRQIQRAERLLEREDPESIKKGPHDVTRFIKRTSKSSSGEKAADSYSIDEARIREEEKYDGYYAIATNLEDDAKSIIEVNSKRHRIEDCFRVLKTDFSARPVFHRKRERITAHFMICYTALLIYRLLEAKLDDAGTHFTISQILQTLRNMNVANAHDLYYMATYGGSQVCTAFNDLLGLGLDRRYYQPKDLNKKIRNILK